MTEATRRDREVAESIAGFTCDVLTSRSLYERELLAVRDVCGAVVASYRAELAKSEQDRVLAAVHKSLLSEMLADDADAFCADALAMLHAQDRGET